MFVGQNDWLTSKRPFFRVKEDQFLIDDLVEGEQKHTSFFAGFSAVVVDAVVVPEDVVVTTIVFSALLAEKTIV